MDSIISKLTEIEDAAASIVHHADEQKDSLDKEFDEKRKNFDAGLEKKTQARIDAIRSDLEKDTSRLLDSQNSSSDAAIEALKKEYDERHTEYAREILKHITEV